MGWNTFAWLFGKQEEPPERLVLGAELECMLGSEHSYLIVKAKGMDINKLPGACVLDRKEFENIMPFGYCSFLGCPCKDVMKLEERWENLEPQKMNDNGEEIITTKSSLLCKTAGGWIDAVTSGQHGVFAMQWAELQTLKHEFEEKYPGLLEILTDPCGSLYLNEGMYKVALQFLEYCVNKNRGELSLATVYASDDLEGMLMKATLVHLLPDIGSARQESFLSVLKARSGTINMHNESDWSANLLNKKMLERLKTYCADMAEKIETSGMRKRLKENGQFTRSKVKNVIDMEYRFKLGYSTTEILPIQNEVVYKLKKVIDVVRYSENDEVLEREEDSVAEVDSVNGDKVMIESNSILLFPKPGDTISISKGIDLADETAIVSSWNTWSREYSVEGCKKIYSDSLCYKRLKYAIENYECNSTDNDLLMFNLEGYDEIVFAGAMVDGYANIGDIVQVTLDDDSSFNFLILDTKSTQHTSQELASSNQCQCEWGHGYLLGKGTVQLSVCEFITAGNCSEDNVQNTKSGAFLKQRSVIKAQIVDHIQICD